MTQKNDGGPAFGRVEETFNGRMDITQGMSLRDYFAAKAIQAIVNSNNGVRVTPDHPDYALWAAQFSYSIADAMILERSKT